MDELRIEEPSGKTATLLILIGLLFEVVEIVVSLVVVLVVVVSVLLFALLVPFLVIGVVWLALVYAFSYRRARAGRYSEARTPTIVFAILSLLTLNLVSGVLYLVAWVKLGTAVTEQSLRRASVRAAQTPAGGVAVMVGSDAVLVRKCRACGAAIAVVATYCPACGAPSP